MQYVLHHVWLTSCHAWSSRVGSAPVVCVYNHAVSLPDRQDVKVTCVLQQGRSQLTLVDKGNGMSKSDINTLGNPFGICVFIPLIHPSCVFIPLPAIASTCLRRYLLRPVPLKGPSMILFPSSQMSLGEVKGHTCQL